jgi:hypothetical protein
MALSQKQITDVCCFNTGSRECRYLDDDIEKGQTIFVCKKLSPDKNMIDEGVTEFLEECKEDGKDPLTQGYGLADNCSGYVVLKTKMQGYDV